MKELQSTTTKLLPFNKHVSLGYYATLECLLNNERHSMLHTKLKYVTWFFNDNPIDRGDFSYEVSPDNYTLTLLNLDSSYTGYYHCDVSYKRDELLYTDINKFYFDVFDYYLKTVNSYLVLVALSIIFCSLLNLNKDKQNYEFQPVVDLTKKITSTRKKERRLRKPLAIEESNSKELKTNNSSRKKNDQSLRKDHSTIKLKTST